MSELTSQVMQMMQTLSRSEDQTRSAVFEAKFICWSCGRERTTTLPGVHAYVVQGYECPACALVRRERRFRNLCPVLYQKSDLDRLPGNALKEVMAWENGSTGLLLVGETGTGKTRCAWRLLDRVLVFDKKELSFEWFDAIGFGHAISRHYQNEDAEVWLERLARIDLLFFDDLGKLKLTERAETELFGLIERRCAAQLPIIATTNDTGDSLAARLTDNRGPALIRRLREFCKIIQFSK